jgi:hypothetical protein
MPDVASTLNHSEGLILVFLSVSTTNRFHSLYYIGFTLQAQDKKIFLLNPDSLSDGFYCVTRKYIPFHLLGEDSHLHSVHTVLKRPSGDSQT